MKILHIIDSGGLYGAEVMLLNLVAEQIKQGLSPTIASIGEKYIQEKQIETEAIKRNFKVAKFPMRPGPNFVGALEVLKFAHQKDFHILHSHGYKGNILLGLLPRKIRKIPMVSTLHGWTSTNGFSKMRLYEWLDRKSLKHIDSVVLVTNAMKSHPKLKGLKGINFHVIPNGIPIPEKRVGESTNQRFNHSSTQQFNQSPTQFNDLTNQPFNKKIEDFCSKGFTIGSIGRLSSEKGYKYLIESLGLLVNKGIDARLIIIGEGYERSMLENLVTQLGLSDLVMMPGYLDDAKQYIPFFSVYAIPSRTEGLPITLLEAIQAKVPIVASKVGGMPEVLDNGSSGIIVQPCKPDELAEAVRFFYSNKRMVNEMTRMAYQRVTTHYASKAMALQYLDVYKRHIQTLH